MVINLNYRKNNIEKIMLEHGALYFFYIYFLFIWKLMRGAYNVLCDGFKPSTMLVPGKNFKSVSLAASSFSC